MIDEHILNNIFFVTEVTVNMMCSIQRNIIYWSMFSSVSMKVFDVKVVIVIYV